MIREQFLDMDCKQQAEFLSKKYCENMNGLNKLTPQELIYKFIYDFDLYDDIERQLNDDGILYNGEYEETRR